MPTQGSQSPAHGTNDPGEVDWRATLIIEQLDGVCPDLSDSLTRQDEVLGGRLGIVPTPYPKEFRREVVARQGDPVDRTRSPDVRCIRVLYLSEPGCRVPAKYLPWS